MYHSRQRREDRVPAAVNARLRFGGVDADAVLLNASSRGVLASTSMPPPRGTPIAVCIGGGVLKGEVRWRGSERCGIRLRDTIDVASLLDGRVLVLSRPSAAPASWSSWLLQLALSDWSSIGRLLLRLIPGRRHPAVRVRRRRFRPG